MGKWEKRVKPLGDIGCGSTGAVRSVSVFHTGFLEGADFHREEMHRWKTPVGTVKKGPGQKRSLMLALMSRMTSRSSVLVRTRFSILSTECMTVVWCWP